MRTLDLNTSDNIWQKALTRCFFQNVMTTEKLKYFVKKQVHKNRALWS